MLRKFLSAKIHGAVVNEACLDYEGSITIPTELLGVSGIMPNEAVSVWNITRGTRFETYVLVGEKRGWIAINGAAAHLAQVGDRIIIASFCYVTDSFKLKVKEPRILFLDESNNIRRQSHREEVGAKWNEGGKRKVI